MVTQRDILVEAERRRAEMAWADKERRIRRVTRHNAPSANGYQGWLAGLGVQLQAWGDRLQGRYDEPLSISGSAQHER